MESGDQPSANKPMPPFLSSMALPALAALVAFLFFMALPAGPTARPARPSRAATNMCTLCQAPGHLARACPSQTTQALGAAMNARVVAPGDGASREQRTAQEQTRRAALPPEEAVAYRDRHAAQEQARRDALTL